MPWGSTIPRPLGSSSNWCAVLAEQGRYPDAESLLRVALQIKRDLGMPEQSTPIASSLNQLGRLLTVQGRTREAAQIYAQLDTAIKNWPAKMRESFEINNSRVYQAYAAGQFEVWTKNGGGLAGPQPRAFWREAREHRHRARHIGRRFLPCGQRRARQT